MVNEFCGFKHGVIGTDKMPADTTLNNMKKADLIKLLHTAQHNYESLMWFYNNAVKVNMSQLNNNGWIPCSERLPEPGERYLVSGVWKDEYFEKHSVYDAVYGTDGIWHTYEYKPTMYEVIAWQPLPDPYKEK